MADLNIPMPSNMERAYNPNLGSTPLQPFQATQIYQLVNSIFSQMTGRSDIVATDSASLVAMGDAVGQTDKGGIYLTALARRIGRTIDSFRIYNGDFSDFKRDEMTWGAAVQKLYTDMPDAVIDDSVNVGQMDGQSLDHYIINNPKVEQKIFEKICPYSFFITIQDYWLRDAFLNAGAMYGLINYIFGQCQNKMEAVHEDLARLALANIFVNLPNTQVFHLVSMYNTETGKSISSKEAMYNKEFLRFAIGRMNNISKKMTKMSVVYNAEGKLRFTPYSKQSMFMLADFDTQLETVVQYEAFNVQYVKLRNYISVPYWQAIKDGQDINNWDVISQVYLNNAQGSPTRINNIISAIVDWDAFGTFREEKRVATTPINARGLYYNTFWHERQMWFNDLGENVVMFTLD